MSRNSRLTFFIMTLIIAVQQSHTKTRYGKAKKGNIKYILVDSFHVNFFNVTGMSPFKNANCTQSNCILTNDRNYFKSLKYFDAIIFHGPDYWYRPSLLDKLPSGASRSQVQKYIFYSPESAHYYPLCDVELDGYFNFTWTFRLNSDLPSPYLVVRDINGTVIAPRVDMAWIKVKDMMPIDNDIKRKLKTKSKAVAWMASNCKTKSQREDLVVDLALELAIYGLILDVYGKCSNIKFQCDSPDLLLPDCWDMFEEDYYFYLSFENSFDEDYVTEKVLLPMQRYTVPVVYGAANYSWFLPDGSYLNAKELGVNKLAKEISDIIADKEKYYNFFKWHNHYSLHSPYEFPETNPICGLCSLVNLKLQNSAYEYFRDWWNGPDVCP